ncbi:VOC family protein [Arhodomonas sp. AD133]|uniref:VOC family protein n=1 Tax=Arhodomonas sp. AD133 TaxID=3415009 RepID=UPI003EB81B7A
MQPRISMITLGVTDLPTAVRFYEHGLGLPRYPFDSDEVAFFDLNGSWLSLHPREMLAADAATPDEGMRGFPGFTLAHNVASREAVDAVLAEAVAAGGRLVKPAQDVYWGGYSGYFADPDGYLWEVAWNPYVWIGPEDA